MWSKIVEIFYPFKEDKEFFVLKNERTWYSVIYREILYSGNGGKSFRKIYNARSPLFSHGDTIFKYNWTFEPLTFGTERQSFSNYKNQFTCLQDVREFEKKEWQRFLNGKEEVKKRRKEYTDNFNKSIS